MRTKMKMKMRKENNYPQITGQIYVKHFNGGDA